MPAAGAACVLLLAAQPVFAQVGAPPGAWPTYGGDLANTRYSGLAQIEAANFDQLEVAWRFKTDSLGPRPEFRFESTPLMANGRLYTITGLGIVSALDPGTGETLWMHDPQSYEIGRPNNGGFLQRGMEHWTDGDDERLLIGTADAYLLALDARTGEPVAEFGDNGRVDIARP